MITIITHDYIFTIYQIEEDLLSKEHGQWLKEQVADVIHFVKENPDAAEAMAQSAAVAEARREESANTLETSVVGAAETKVSAATASSTPVSAISSTTSTPVLPADTPVLSPTINRRMSTDTIDSDTQVKSQRVKGKLLCM